MTGASGGIGAASALEFAKRGFDVLLVGRRRDALEAVADSLRPHGGEYLVLAGDLADLTFAERTVGEALAHWGRLDVLVNNAAWREVVTMRNISLESWNRTLHVCLTVPAFLSRWCAVHMEAQRAGVIINVSSIQSFQASGLSPAYSAAKGGMDALTREMAVLYGASGVRVLGVNFGAIDTDFGGGGMDAGDFEAGVREFAEDMIPLRRYGTPEEAAKTIVMLAGDDAAYITGAGIVADGGWIHQHLPQSLKHLRFPEEF